MKCGYEKLHSRGVGLNRVGVRFPTKPETLRCVISVVLSLNIF
jgi:hypothetical protein